MRTAVILLPILFILAIIIIWAVVRAYNKRLDKIANGELHDTHSSIPEPGTAVSVVYQAVLMAIVIITFLTLSATNGLIQSLQNSINSLQTRQNSLVYEVNQLRELLEERDKHVASSTYEITNPNYENQTADVTFTVLMRQYTENTAVSLNLNGQGIPLEKTAPGAYSGQFTAYFFDEYAEPLICITEDGKTITEKTDFPPYIFYNFFPLPGIAANMSSRTAFGKMTCEGNYTIEVNQPEDIKKATVTYLTGGREIKTLDITEDVQNRNWITLEKDLDLEKDLTFRIELMMKNGYKIVDQTIMTYEVTAFDEEMEFQRIYDPKGNLIWEGEFKKG